MLTLNELLCLICERTNVHVCIHDISGLLSVKGLETERRFKTHTKPICETVKLYESGYNACISCKDASNRRAAQRQEFSRVCPFGIYEIVRPVVISGKVRCIIYLGNLAKSQRELSRLSRKGCDLFGVPFSELSSLLSETEVLSEENGAEYYERLCEFIRDFIIELYDERNERRTESGGELHWCVKDVCEYSRANFQNPITLSHLARLYFINEKYLGRLFKRETGQSYSSYLNDLRLKASLPLLRSGKSVISVSEECGFHTVTYFNRCFKKAFGMTPGEYRKKQ